MTDAQSNCTILYCAPSAQGVHAIVTGEQTSAERTLTREGNYWITSFLAVPGKYLVKFKVDGAYVVDSSLPNVTGDAQNEIYVGDSLLDKVPRELLPRILSYILPMDILALEQCSYYLKCAVITYTTITEPNFWERVCYIPKSFRDGIRFPLSPSYWKSFYIYTVSNSLIKTRLRTVQKKTRSATYGAVM